MKILFLKHELGIHEWMANDRNALAIQNFWSQSNDSCSTLSKTNLELDDFQIYVSVSLKGAIL